MAIGVKTVGMGLITEGGEASLFDEEPDTDPSVFQIACNPACSNIAPELFFKEFHIFDML